MCWMRRMRLSRVRTAIDFSVVDQSVVSGSPENRTQRDPVISRIWATSPRLPAPVSFSVGMVGLEPTRSCSQGTWACRYPTSRCSRSSSSGRVRGRHCCRLLPSEPCVQVSLHTAQAIDSCMPYSINLLGRSEVHRSRSANTRYTCAMSLRLPFHPSLSLARPTTSVNHLSKVSALLGWP